MIPNSMAGPADGDFVGECLELFRRGTRNVIGAFTKRLSLDCLKLLQEGCHVEGDEEDVVFHLEVFVVDDI